MNTVDLSQEHLDKYLNGLIIPPRPDVLTKLSQEMKKDDVNLGNVALIISSDVGLAAAVLKTINSPLFGLRTKVTSIAKAVNMLGLKSTTQIVTGLTLRHAISGKNESMHSYWDSAETVANIAAYIATTLTNISREDAHIFGLFHDVGVAMLMQKYPNYRETLKVAAASSRNLTEVEDERHASNHATLGYLMAKSWFLPPAMCDAILRHHDVSAFDDSDPISAEARTLIAIISLSNQLIDAILYLRENLAWEHFKSRVLDHLGITDAEYLELKDQVSEQLECIESRQIMAK
ncbi:MAG: HDOD domain-containing protein [Burkholderiales bacterium]